MDTNALPLELWDQIASYLTRDDYIRCLRVNKDWNNLMTTLLLPKYGSELPRKQEILECLKLHPVILLDNNGGWVEIESLTGKSDRYVVYTKKAGQACFAITKRLNEVGESVDFSRYTLDPKSYNDILRQRKSVVRVYPRYAEDMTLLHIEELLKNFDTFGTKKWRMLELIIDTFTLNKF